jgi:PAS domain S-box-containing protein
MDMYARANRSTFARAIGQTIHLRTLRLAALVFAGYYVGTRVGMALTFLPNPIAVLWPSNAVLFAAMVLLPTRTWWVVIAAALPAHVLAELQAGVPIAMVLCWFVSNVFEAVIGAACTRWLARRAVAFDTRRDVIAFIGAVAISTVLSSFLDSGFVVLNDWGSRAYWDLWQSRIFSNTTSALVVVPLIVTWLTPASLPRHRPSPMRRVEGAALVLALVVSTYFVFDVRFKLPASPLWVYVPLPFLLWTALRFSLRATTASIAVVALLVIWGTGHSLGPLSTGSPVHDARSVQFLLLFVAPTLLSLAAALQERGRADAALRVRDTRFRLMLEATKDSVYDRDMATDRLSWSGSSLEAVGYDPERRPATFGAWLNVIHPDDRGHVAATVARTIAEGDTRWQSEFRVRRGDGSYAHVREKGFVVRDERGSSVQAIAALTDTTERHDMDELSSRLAHASRLTAMGELTASIAHEINQPMSAILSNVDAAEMLLDSGQYHEEELRSILEDIRSDDLRASEIIRHIRGLAKKGEANVQHFALHELIEGVQRLVAPIAQRRRVQLGASFCGATEVLADRIHVQQVLLNLLFNGMDAMDGVYENARRIDVTTLCRDDGFVEVAVRDSGNGIRPEQIGRVFDSFFTTKRDGMGLGLSIARSLVEANGGAIWASNNEGSGATFRFTLRATTPGA